VAAPRLSRNTRPSDDRPLVLLLGLGLIAYYGLTLGGHHYSIDGIVMFESAKRLLFHHSLVLDPPLRWGNAVYAASPFGIGLSLAYLPALVALAPFASRLRNLTATPYEPSLPYNPELYSNLPYLLSSWVNPLLTAATGCLVLILARRVGLSRPWSVGAGLAFGIASPAAAYARFDFAQPLAGFALVASLTLLASPGSLPSTAGLVGAGASLGAMVLTRPDLAILAPWVILWTVLRTRRLRDGFVVTLPVGLAVAMQLVINWSKHGNPLDTGYGSLARLFPFSPRTTLEGILGLLFGPSHGMLIFFPLAWLSALGLRRLAREQPATARLWTGLVAMLIVFYGAYRVWWAGWSWGPRFLLPLVPLLTVAATFWAARASRPGRLVFVALFVVGVSIAWNGVLVDFVTLNQWLQQTEGPSSGARAQFRLLASPLLSGWMLLTKLPPDLLWLHLWRTGSPTGGALVAGIVVLLGGCLAVSVYRLAAVLRESPAQPPGRPRARRRA
jgi:hypothetical protein